MDRNMDCMSPRDGAASMAGKSASSTARSAGGCSGLQPGSDREAACATQAAARGGRGGGYWVDAGVETSSFADTSAWQACEGNPSGTF
jgi:hypothetical protein